MTRRLLLVEPSTTMRHVLEKHVRALGYTIESTDSYQSARDTLRRQYLAFESDITGVVCGWPSVSEDAAEQLLELLASDDFADIPVLVMSTDMRAETRAWVAERERTEVLPWKDYLGVEALLDRLLDAALVAPDERVASSTTPISMCWWSMTRCRSATRCAISSNSKGIG